MSGGTNRWRTRSGISVTDDSNRRVRWTVFSGPTAVAAAASGGADGAGSPP